MIRRAQTEDVVGIAELYQRSFATLAFLPTLHSLDEHVDWFGRAVAEREVWVYEEGDAILGFAALDGEELSHLYVEPNSIGRGVGSALFEHAKRRRPDGLVLWVFQKNERARRFYERRGCRLIRRTDGSGNEEKTPDALYEWRPV